MFTKMGHDIVTDTPEVALNFIQGYHHGVRNILRLDGIYFNTAQDWQQQNDPIRASYNLADAVVVQSQFNKELVFRYFGERGSVHVIHNGTPLEVVREIEPVEVGHLRENVWLCASSWRPHKRLAENIKYFQHHAGSKEVLFVAGSGDLSSLESCGDSRVQYVGDLSWEQLISLMKASGNFLHLAYLDHCPNVVVDANAAGCKVHCSNTGGTKEIAGENSVIVVEEEWDYSPIDLYNPPPIDFNKTTKNNRASVPNDITEVAKKYQAVLED